MQCLGRPAQSIGSTGSSVKDGCELPDVGVGTKFGSSGRAVGVLN